MAVESPQSRDVGATVHRLRRELSPEPERPISQERFGRLLEISWSSVARWERGHRPEPDTARRLVRLAKVLEALGELVAREDRLTFFEQRHPRLLKLRPIDLLNTDDGMAAILEFLKAAETGAFA